MEYIFRELRFALRALSARRGFAASVGITLALGIGATTAIFSVIDSVLLRPLPYPQPEQLVGIFLTGKEAARAPFLPAEFNQLRSAVHGVQTMAGYSSSAFNLQGGGHAVRVNALSVTPDFFNVLGTVPLIGHGFPEKYEHGGGRYVILGHKLWLGEFNGDPAIVGATIKVDDEACTVIGVMPAGFRFTEDADIFVPASLTPTLSSDGTLRITPLRLIGRLRQSGGMEEAQEECDSVLRRMPSTTEGERHVRLLSLSTLMTEQARRPLALLFGAVALVLLIACANAAILVLAQSSRRLKELAVRAAMGAGIRQLAVSQICESLLLSALGGAGGFLLAFWCIRAIPTVLPPDIPVLYPIRIDPLVLVFGISISVLMGLVLAALPVARLSSLELITSLKAGPEQCGRPSLVNLRGGLVIAEVATTLLLLVGGGLLTRNIVHLLRADLGFDPSGLAAFSVSLPQSHSSRHQMLLFYQDALNSIAAVPGITAASVVNPLPFSGGTAEGPFLLRGQAVPSEEQFVSQSIVGAGYFQALRIRLVRGRYPAGSAGLDRREAAVDESFVRRFLDGADPIGQQISVEQDRSGQPFWLDIVGIVGAVRREGADAEPEPVVYVPLASTSQQTRLQNMTFVVRTAAPIRQVAASVQSSVSAAEPSVPVFGSTTVRRLVANSMASQTISTLLVCIFAAVATTLSFVGIFGVTSQMVTERRAEIGIRVALGAGRASVLRLILSHSLSLVAAGMVAGSAAAFFGRRLANHWVSLSSVDGMAIFGLASASLFVVASVACYLSARKALAVDPIAALRV